jgi:hypothetical protein
MGKGKTTVPIRALLEVIVSTGYCLAVYTGATSKQPYQEIAFRGGTSSQILQSQTNMSGTPTRAETSLE